MILLEAVAASTTGDAVKMRVLMGPSKCQDAVLLGVKSFGFGVSHFYFVSS